MTEQTLPSGTRQPLSYYNPGERCTINGHLCEVVRQARRTTYVRIIDGEWSPEKPSPTVQLNRDQGGRIP